VLSTTGASTNTLNQQRQQTLVRGRGGMCVTHPPAETSENGVSQCAMIRTGPALAVIARRTPGVVPALALRDLTGRKYSYEASSYLLHDGIQYLFDRNESDNSREAPPPLYPAFRAREARVHLSLSRGLHSPFPRRYSSHSVHSSQVMRVSECETLMSARRS
jgi:hypothetical protein